MRFAMVGLGRMGSGMTERLRRHGLEVMTYDPKVESTASSLEELATQLERPRIFWLMVPSGDITEATFQEALGVLDEDDVIVDGGNSYFRDSIRRHDEAKQRGIHFVDVGVSGGIWGLEVGFCLMAGGDAEPASRLTPIFEGLAPENGWAHVAGPGSGHFVKMVHNGIEYGLMEAYAEGFELMSHSPFDLDLEEIAGIWRYGSVVRSWLLDLLYEAFKEHGSKLEDIAPYVEDSGEGRWTINEAIDLNVPVPVIASSLFARFASRREINFGAKVAAALRNQFGGHAVRAAEKRVEDLTEVAENPLHEGLERRRTPDPCVFVIFGASGDLTRRKLFPALYALAYRKMLPERFAVLGSARSPMSSEEFRKAMEEAVREHVRVDFKQEIWDELVSSTYYVPTEFGDDHMHDLVTEKLAELDREHGTEGNRIFYLAIPPSAIPMIVHEIGERRSPHGWSRVVVEKPFGVNLASAQRLNQELLRHFHENEIFRIDHYLGKETVQNMLALRFANGIFEPLWTRQYVDHVQITVAESIGIGGRASFYEKLGASRDVFQNHLLQLVAFTAMEPPIDFDADAVRNEKAKVLRAMEVDAVLRGQYGPGYVEGQMVPGYREEEGVDSDSTTETYVAAKLRIDTWRWADTPFYVRTGKRLPRRETTIAIQFKRVPQSLFAHADGLRPNVLAIHVQPDEGVSLGIGAKVPGQGMTVRTVNMDFLYGGAFRTGLPEAYERLILDAMRGDPTLFTRADEIEEQWRLADSFLGRWVDQVPDFPNYDAGTWGPVEADELLHRDGRSWSRH